MTSPLDLDIDNREKVKKIKFAHELDKMIKNNPEMIENLSFGVYKARFVSKI